MNSTGQNNSYKILIIDDDEDLSMIISELLTDYGYRVTHVTDGNGFSICRELRRVSTVPVLFASGGWPSEKRCFVPVAPCICRALITQNRLTTTNYHNYSIVRCLLSALPHCSIMSQVLASPALSRR